MGAEGYPQGNVRGVLAAEERHRVFCASLADVFEGEDTMPAESWPIVQEARYKLFELIEQTPHLDWLLLTKRPQNVEYILRKTYTPTLASLWHKLEHGFLPNIWIGTSVENQQAADVRIPHLLQIPARVRFLSCEPLLGPVSIAPWLWATAPSTGGLYTYPSGRVERGRGFGGRMICHKPAKEINWVICGGESGSHARPMHPDWARSLRDQCQAAGVPFHFKQWGEWLPFEETTQPPFWLDQTGREWDGHGLDIIDPETGEIGKRWHEDSLHGESAYKKVGKVAAGRLLDGRTWDESPKMEGVTR